MAQTFMPAGEETVLAAPEGQEVRNLSASDFVLLVLLAIVLVYVLPSKLLRWARQHNSCQH